MGADISVFEEDQLENDLEFLCKNESLVDLFKRTLSGMTEVLTQPKRLEYNSALLTDDRVKGYSVEEFKYSCSDGVALHCAKWVRNNKSDVCIIYLHTNMRALLDATEVLPLCNLLDANLLAFDMRGCGKSEGTLSLNMATFLGDIVQSMLENNPNLNVVIWSRGIATHVAIEYVSSARLTSNVKFLVLDSPFTSVEDIVSNKASSIQTFGITVPSVFVKFAVQMVRRSVRSQIGGDPYSVRPIRRVPSARVPCFILSADDDEYIPDEMGHEIAATWNRSVPSWHREFPGQHFGERDECLVLTPLEKIISVLQQQDSPVLDELTELDTLRQLESNVTETDIWSETIEEEKSNEANREHESHEGNDAADIPMSKPSSPLKDNTNSHTNSQSSTTLSSSLSLPVW
eukprot:CAMPEP_0185037390 /NCGR_PEP_ID=MMETSP1103-20130426/31725_1 /TAXON_ID=36769 /ORGANISM="Paraphysomonas bandaiensis, Strain Caron Lab Isolate" /LENGTH=402 /DNA_ID=CAMNT_0027575343 /DNA_START=102 /DNA_END=1307 /DNA_ORIENTATION=+